MEMQIHAIVTDEDTELYPAVIFEWLASWHNEGGTRFRSSTIVLEFGPMRTFQTGTTRTSVDDQTYTSRNPKYRTWTWHDPEQRSLPIWVSKEELDAYSSVFDT